MYHWLAHPWLGGETWVLPEATQLNDMHVALCGRQVSETEPFIVELLGELTATMQDLGTCRGFRVLGFGHRRTPGQDK